MKLNVFKRTGLAVALGVALSASSWIGSAHAGGSLIVVCLFDDETGDLTVASVG